MNKAREEQKFWDERFVQTIKALAPGTLLREGLENVLRAKMGALVLIGGDAAVMEIVDGGFSIDCQYTPTAFYELAKMDGALILSDDAARILRANTQLLPDPSIFTSETGTRHRTAERVAKQTGLMVIAISQRRNLITLYLGQLRYTLKDISVILNRANQALQTLEKYWVVLNKGLNTLTALEFEDLATLADVAALLIRAEAVNRIAQEIERNIIELGIEGNLVSMQMEEMLGDEDPVYFLIKDYCADMDQLKQAEVRAQLASLPEDGLEAYSICRLLGYGVTPSAIDIPVVPRGYRILTLIPRIPVTVMDNVVAHFKTLPRINGANLAELDDVEGIGAVRARAIKDGLKRIREQILFER